MAKNESNTMFITCLKRRINEEEGRIEFLVENEMYEPPKPVAEFYRYFGDVDEYYWLEYDTLFEPETEIGLYMLDRVKNCYADWLRLQR